ncbi:MAG TPA: arylamine N-acetyltransferase [Thermoanaerobaculia bacterium]
MSVPETDDILAALDLSRAEPGRGLLEALFTRFVARVPFETVSKILRHADVGNPREKPRVPQVFWSDFLEWGAGGTCYARVAAFRHLLLELGFDCRLAVGKIEADFDHAALLVSGGGGEGAEWIADVGFPLPALLPAAPGEFETGLGAVRVARGPRGWVVDLLEGVPIGARRIEIFDAPVPDEEYRERWRATFREGSKFLSRVSMRVQREARVTSYVEGELRIDDAHTRLAIPLPAPRAARLEQIFGVDAEKIARAVALVGEKEEEPSTASSVPTITAWIDVEAPPQLAWEAVASPKGHAALLSGVGEASAPQVSADGWRLTVSPPARMGEISGAPVIEEARPHPEKRELQILRRAGDSVFESVWRVELHGGRTHLARTARVSASPEELLRNDALRGRLAAALAVDLVAWSRILGSGL